MTGNFSSIYMSRNRVRSWNEPSFTIQAGGRHAPLHPDAPIMIKVGKDKMKWLSNEYRRSPYMIECGRGNIDLPQDKDTPPFNVPGNFLIDGPVEYEEDISE